MTECNQLAVLGQLVLELDAGAAHVGGMRGDVDHIVVPRRRFVASEGLHHRQERAAFFHGVIGAAGGPNPLGTADLEQAHVVTVVEVTHLIGIAVQHAITRHLSHYSRILSSRVFSTTAVSLLICASADWTFRSRAWWVVPTTVTGRPSSRFDSCTTSAIEMP